MDMNVRNRVDVADALAEVRFGIVGFEHCQVSIHFGMELHLDDVAGIGGHETMNTVDHRIVADPFFDRFLG